ncbi:hypothetical protein A6R68_23087, partial [Neotoma lepida]
RGTLGRLRTLRTVPKPEDDEVMGARGKAHAASPYTRKIGLPRGTPTRGGAAEPSGSDVARECRSRGSRRRRLLPAPQGWAAAGS